MVVDVELLGGKIFFMGPCWLVVPFVGLYIASLVTLVVDTRFLVLKVLFVLVDGVVPRGGIVPLELVWKVFRWYCLSR